MVGILVSFEFESGQENVNKRREAKGAGMRVLMLFLLLLLPARAESLSLRLQVYDAGRGPVRFILRVENLTGAPLTLTQPSSQTHDFLLTRQGVQVWKWSADKLFMETITERVFKPGETVIYTGEWDRADVTGKPVPPGKLTVKAWLPVVQGESPPTISRDLKL